MDLKDNFSQIFEESINKITALIKETQFIGGEEISLFENEFAEYCGTEYAVGCSNGTDALVVALKSLGIGHGDTVLVPANTFIATSEAVSLTGASVDFIDVCKNSSLINPDKLIDYLEMYSNRKKIKAVVAVHLYGRMAEMDVICTIAEKYGLKVIEDSAQAHGAKYKGNGPGFYGDIATFSFYPGKNLGAFGDAGALVTNDFEIYEYCKKYVNHGRDKKKYIHDIEAANMRMDTIQAAVLRIKLKYLADWTETRNIKVQIYFKYLSDIIDIDLPEIDEQFYQVWHLFVIRVKKREELQLFLKEAGISTGVHYPIPLHLQPAYNYKGCEKGDFPVTEKLAKDILSLPLWPEITEEQIKYISDKIRLFYSR